MDIDDDTETEMDVPAPVSISSKVKEAVEDNLQENNVVSSERVTGSDVLDNVIGTFIYICVKESMSIHLH